MTEHTRVPVSRPLKRFFAPFDKLAHASARLFIQGLRSSLFSAALGVLAIHVGALAVVTKMSLLIVANLALNPPAPANLTGTGPVVIYLSDAVWQNRYLERSPLDRCRMAEDLQQIMAHGPRSLTVDFDLSPGLKDDSPACQVRLNEVLDRHGSKLVLLSPFKVSSDSLLKVKADWMRARCASGAAFGDGGLNVSLGAVIDFPPETSGMADAVHDRARALVCDQIATPAGLNHWLRRDETANVESTSTKEEAINFAGFAEQVAPLALENPAMAQVANWGQRDVFYGGDFGGAKEDRFVTPMGTLPGVVVHAAIAWTLSHPVHEPHPLLGFGIDVLTAYIFSLVIIFFWKKYMHYRLDAKGYRSQFSTVAICVFVAAYVLVVILFFIVAGKLFARGVLIAPLVIALGMLVDGFVRGPIDEIVERNEEGHATTHPVNPAIKIISGNLQSLLPAVLMVAFLSKILHGMGEVACVAIGMLAGVLVDRIFASCSRIRRVRKARGGAELSRAWRWAGPALGLAAFVAVAAGVDRFYGARIGTLESAFLGANALLVALLLMGLVSTARVPLYRVGSHSSLRKWTGFAHAPSSWEEMLGAFVFLLRQLVFWAVFADAMFIMFD